MSFKDKTLTQDEIDLKKSWEEKVAVPGYFYKIVASGPLQNLKVIAFLVPNAESRLPLQYFVVSVDSLEQLTKINFFNKLPHDVQESLESRVVLDDWRF